MNRSLNKYTREIAALDYGYDKVKLIEHCRLFRKSLFYNISKGNKSWDWFSYRVGNKPEFIKQYKQIARYYGYPNIVITPIEGVGEVCKGFEMKTWMMKVELP